jgi:hypothetical protein
VYRVKLLFWDGAVATPVHARASILPARLIAREFWKAAPSSLLTLASRVLSQFYEIGLVSLTLNQHAPAFSQSRRVQINTKWE